LHHRPTKSFASGSQSADSLCKAATDDHEAESFTVEPKRSKHQRKQEQKAARKKNARRQQVDVSTVSFPGHFFLE